MTALLWGLLGAKLLSGWGLAWDIRWHLTVGRDSFWIPPHVMAYAGGVVAAGIPFAVLLADPWRARRGATPPGTLTVCGLTGSPGFHLAWWGMLLTILAAPLDDLWHRLFGLDVTLWSPPHLLGLGGAQLNTLACLGIARELWPVRAPARSAALVLGGALALGIFPIAADQSVQAAFVHGGLGFFAWAVLGGAFFTFTLVLGARATGWRTAPLLVALLALGLHVLDMAVPDVGFAVLQPASHIEEAIAADPSSTVAIAHEMARRNGVPPGRSPLLRIVVPVPAALLALAGAALALAFARALHLER